MTSLRLQERIRTGIITGLLVLGLLFVGLLSHQTYVAFSSQQTLVQDILRDYATLAADEFRRRANFVGFYGIGRVIGRLAQVPRQDPLPLPEQLPELLQIDEEERRDLGRATMLAKGFFRYDARSGILTHTGDILEDTESGLIKRMLEPGSDEQLRFSGTHHENIDGESHNFVFTQVSEDYYVGLRINEAEAINWLRFFIDQRPLIPQSLAGGKLDNEWVYVSLRGLEGSEVFTIGTFESGMQLVTESLEGRMYEGLSLQVGIYPKAVDSLIIGGLPVDRLPSIYGGTASLLWTLWILAVLMIGSALLFVRRERAIAHLRSDFVSRVSHELRTPLAQIMMFAQTLMLGRVRSDNERLRAIKVIDKEAQRLSHLVDNVLNFSRVERGSQEVQISAQPLFPLVREITDQFRGLMNEGDLILHSQIKEDARVMLDPDAFRQMFVNILDNAVKYSPSGENVDILLKENGDRIDVSVEDRGIGVPTSEKQRIWEPYYRTPDIKKQAIGGTGIGLAVVQELARLQTARVSVSDRDGGGARFTMGFELAGRMAS
ncbi:MAG: hypothetical protein CMP98_12160 [Gammaproteobacteria bacterium]|nr:hypothetical protein [Gammaproteobacteria bacterium]OUU07704.1 MAG: hypothetical protein CBB94_12525 [Gammaproteobacteria bacterium TMED34]